MVATTGVGVQTRVRVLDAAGSILTDYTPVRGRRTPAGCTWRPADFDGDGTPDVVVGADAGGGPRVQVFRGLTQTVLADFFAYDAGRAGRGPRRGEGPDRGRQGRAGDGHRQRG